MKPIHTILFVSTHFKFQYVKKDINTHSSCCVYVTEFKCVRHHSIRSIPFIVANVWVLACILFVEHTHTRTCRRCIQCVWGIFQTYSWCYICICLDRVCCLVLPSGYLCNHKNIHVSFLCIQYPRTKTTMKENRKEEICLNNLLLVAKTNFRCISAQNKNSTQHTIRDMKPIHTTLFVSTHTKLHIECNIPELMRRSVCAQYFRC